MKVSISNKLFLGCIASVVALVAIGWLSYRTVGDSIAANDWVTHTHEVISQLADGRALLTDAETAQRGFLLTGDDRFLEDTHKAQAGVRAWLVTLRQLTADNLEQQRRLTNLTALVTQRLTTLNDRIAKRQNEGLEAAAAAVSLREGKKLMDQSLEVIEQMSQFEEQLLARRTAISREQVRRTGSVIFISSATACIVGMLAFLMISRDLRRREEAEIALERTRTLLESILDNTPAVIFLKGLDGRYLFVNRRMAEITGKRKEQIVGKTVFDVTPRELAVVADGHQREVLEKQSPIEVEETVQYPDGPHAHLAVKFPVRDENGKIYAIAGVSSDITEKKRAEQVHQHFRALFESLPGLYLVLTPDLKIVAVSDAYLQATMTKRAEILGKGLFEVFPDNPNDPAADGVANLRASLNRVKEKGASDTMAIQKYDVRGPTGEYEERYWSPINSPVLGVDRKIEYIIHRVEDVTDFVRLKSKQIANGNGNGDGDLHKKLERMESEIFQRSQELQEANQQLVSANEELESFSYSVSHDLRAPLRHVDGFVDLLRKSNEEKMDDRGRRYLTIISDSARQMGALIDDLLLFSRIGRTEMRRENVDMNELVKEVVLGLETDIGQRRIEWNIGELPVVYGDRSMLRQVWANLIGNAVKYTRPRDPATIDISSQQEPDGDVTFAVCDNGVGFDMEYSQKLFGVFQRLHRSEEFEGTGIGLANVRRIIHRHGGRAWAEGKVDNGAKFAFSIPQPPQGQAKG